LRLCPSGQPVPRMREQPHRLINPPTHGRLRPVSHKVQASSRTMNIRYVIALLGIITLLFSGCATGSHALVKMSPEEREFAAKLDKVQKGMTENEVVELLGPDYYIKPWMRIWHPPGSGASQVRVYFWNSKVIDVRWMKLGSFVYEPLKEK
jgi:hypothetical protein